VGLGNLLTVLLGFFLTAILGKVLDVYTLWDPEGKKPLRINLNTCSTWDLMTFPEMTAEKAAKLIEAREKASFFGSLEEARRCGFPIPAD
jgi:DNA uptake protein ComE-like DNA-binding protein